MTLRVSEERSKDETWGRRISHDPPERIPPLQRRRPVTSPEQKREGHAEFNTKTTGPERTAPMQSKVIETSRNSHGNATTRSCNPCAATTMRQQPVRAMAGTRPESTMRTAHGDDTATQAPRVTKTRQRRCDSEDPRAHGPRDDHLGPEPLRGEASVVSCI